MSLFFSILGPVEDSVVSKTGLFVTGSFVTDVDTLSIHNRQSDLGKPVAHFYQVRNDYIRELPLEPTTDVVDSLSITEEASPSLTFACVDILLILDSAIPGVRLAVSASDTLNIQEEVQGLTPEDVSLSDSLTITEEVITDRGYNDTLPINEQLYYEGRFGLTQTDALDIVETLDIGKSLGVSVEDTLIITELGNSVIKNVEVSDTLNITESYRLPLTYVDLSDTLNILEDVSLGSSTFNLSASDILSITDEASRVKGATLEDSITITETAIGSRGQSDSLTIIETVLVETLKAPTDSVTITESLLVNKTLNLSLSDTLFITDVLSPISETGGLVSERYAPNGIIDPFCYPLKTRYTIVYSSISAGSIELTSPASDTETVIKQRVVRRTRGEGLKNYRKSNWPERRLLKYTFNLLKQEERDNLLVFLKVSIGEIITLTDYYNRTWTGVIVNPETEFTNRRAENREVTIDFEGVLQ